MRYRELSWAIYLPPLTSPDSSINDYSEGRLGSAFHSQAGASNAVDDPGGSVDDPGGGNIDDKGSFCDPSTSTSTSPKTSASFVTSSLTNRVSLLSLSDKPTVDMIGTTDYATGSFCSSCSIQPTLPGGFWLDGMGCAMCSYDYGG